MEQYLQERNEFGDELIDEPSLPSKLFPSKYDDGEGLDEDTDDEI